MTPEERERKNASNRRYRARHRDRVSAYNAQRWAAMTPAQRDAERERVRHYRQTHPVQTYLSNLHSRRRREAKRRDTE